MRKRLPRWYTGKEPTRQSKRCKRRGFDPWVGRSPREGNSSPLRILAWRIPRTEEPGGLQSKGSQESDTTSGLKERQWVRHREACWLPGPPCGAGCEPRPRACCSLWKPLSEARLCTWGTLPPPDLEWGRAPEEGPERKPSAERPGAGVAEAGGEGRAAGESAGSLAQGRSGPCLPPAASRCGAAGVRREKCLTVRIAQTVIESLSLLAAAPQAPGLVASSSSLPRVGLRRGQCLDKAEAGLPSRSPQD